MANLNFKYGASYAALKALSYAEGTIYVTTEEKAMYVDLGGNRLRLGQTIVFPTWADFNENTTLPPQSPEAFYYIESENALLKYTGYSVDADGNVSGGAWKQINSTADLTSEINSLKTRVSSLETTVTGHTSSIKTINDNIAAINQEIGDPATNDAVATGIYALIDAEEARAKAAEKANATDIANEIARAKAAEQANATNIVGLTSKVNALESKDTELAQAIADEQTRAKAAEKANADAIAEEVTRAKAAEKANADAIDAIKNDILGVKSSINTINEDIEALEAEDISIKQSISELSDTVVQNKTDLQTAIEAEKTRAEAAELGLDSRISSIETASLAYATKTYVDEKVAAEKSRAEAIEADLDDRLDDAESNISSQGDRIGALETDLGTVQGSVSSLNTNLTNLQGIVANKANKTYVDEEIAKINAEIGDPADDATGTASTGLYALIDSLTGGASGLEARVEQAEKDIDALEAADTTINTELTNIKNNYVKISDYNTKVAELEGDINANANDIDALETRAGNIESAATTLTNRVTAVENKNTEQDTLLTTQSGKISNLETNLAKLTSYVGTIPEDSEATNVIEYINSQFAAADAMTYKGGIANVSELLAKTDVEAGDTYVITTNHTANGVSYYAGDLMVAAKDGATVIGEWTHVTTGYQASQENKLVAKDNGVELQSYAGTSLGSLAFNSNNLTIATTSQANPSGGYITNVSINLDWGTF